MRPSRLGQAGGYLGLAGYVVFLAFPLVWLASTAFKTSAEITSARPTLLPAAPTLGNFREAFEEQALGTAALNSLQVAVASALITVVLAVPAAYVLARYRSPVCAVATGWVVVSQVFPLVLVIIPIFLLVRSVGLYDSRTGLVLVYVVWSLPFALWMLRGHVRAIPVELEEAAGVDGASRLRTLREIVLPLLVPGIVATATFAFLSAWNEFFFALVLMKSPDLATLPLTLQRFTGTEGAARFGPLAAASLLATVPGLVFFALAQRRLATGALSGAVKS